MILGLPDLDLDIRRPKTNIQPAEGTFCKSDRPLASINRQ